MREIWEEMVHCLRHCDVLTPFVFSVLDRALPEIRGERFRRQTITPPVCV